MRQLRIAPAVVFLAVLLAAACSTSEAAGARAGAGQTVASQAVASGTVSPLPPSDYSVRSACAAPARGHASCLALELVPETPAARAHTHPLGMARRAPIRAGKLASLCEPATASGGCYGLRPQDLHSAYGLPTTAPSEQTIALVEAYDDPNAEADIGVYDEEFHLPACTSANGCFRKVNEKGKAGPLPETSDGWAEEISLDIEVAHATCESCRILLVEASGASNVSLAAAEETAATLGATEISNSWAGEEPITDSTAFDHPGVAITAASGDFGYLNWNSPTLEGRGLVAYPASSPHVVAVGGTRLAVTSAGQWGSEEVWNGGSSTLVVSRGETGSGCSTRFSAPPWQQALANWSSVGCESKRAVADVSADADPYTGVAIYDSTAEEPGQRAPGWTTIGGTSLSSPLIAATFALAGGAAGVEYPARTLYENEVTSPGTLHDVQTGSNGECKKAFAEEGLSGCTPGEEAVNCSAGAICLAAPGYDGPTGVGTPDGIGAFVFAPPIGPVMKSQSVAFTSNPPGSATVGGTSYTVTAKASSGLPVSFTSSTPTVCSLEGPTVSFTGAGECTIDAEQPGDASYSPALQVQQSFSVGKGSQLLEFTSPPPSSPTAGGPPYKVSATASSGLDVSFSSETPALCSLEGSTVSFTGAGTCTIGTGQAGNSNYDAAPEVRQSFAVGKGSQLIRFTSSPPGSATVHGSAYAISAVATSGLAVSLSSGTPAVCSLGGAAVSFIAAGTCTIDAGQAGSSNYKAAPETQQSFAVGRASQAITFTSSPPTSATVGELTYAVSATASSGMAVPLTSGTPLVCSLVGSSVSFIGAGTCTIEASQAGNAEYEAAAEAQQSFVVSRRSQLMAFTSNPPSLATVSGPSYTVSAGASSGLAALFFAGTPAVCLLEGSTVSFIAAGTCTIDAIQPGNFEYGGSPRIGQSFSVGKGSQLITFTLSPPGSATAGGAGYTVAAASSSGLTVSLSAGTPSVCSLDGLIVNFITAGTCTIDAAQPGNANYDAAPQARQSFIVGAAPLVPMPTSMSTPTPLIAPGSTLTAPHPQAANSSFTLLGDASVHSRSGAVTFKVRVANAGTMSWLLTFPGNTPTASTAPGGRCAAGLTKSDGRCRRSSVPFGQGSIATTAAGVMSFTVAPNRMARETLARPLEEHRGLHVTVRLTFQSSLGGSPVSYAGAITVKLERAARKSRR